SYRWGGAKKPQLPFLRSQLPVAPFVLCRERSRRNKGKKPLFLTAAPWKADTEGCLSPFKPKISRALRYAGHCVGELSIASLFTTFGTCFNHR
ncbi:hypothetical protein BHE74_00022195, partial [Ensete ventricosum]